MAELYFSEKTQQEKDEALASYIREFDFYVILDFKKFRGAIFSEQVDADGEKNMCVTIPLLKNAIKHKGRDRGRSIIGAIKRVNTRQSSHLLLPIISRGMYRSMQEKGYGRMYTYLCPHFGDVVKDIMTIPFAPVFSRDPESPFYPKWLKERKMRMAKERAEDSQQLNTFNDLDSVNLVKPKKQTTYPSYDDADLRNEILKMVNDADK